MIMYTETDLVGIAKRDNNPKRNYLVVNRLQGKHIPVPPHSAFEMFDMLAGRLELFPLLILFHPRILRDFFPKKVTWIRKK